MKFSLKIISVILVCLSFIYSCYVVYICYNNLFVGAYLKYNSDNQLVVDYIQEDSLADYTGLKAGDIILEVNNKKPSKDQPKNSILANVSSLSIERNGQIITTDTRDTIISYDILFTVLIPIVFYLLCLLCVILILKSKKKQTSSFLLILFLLTVSIAYVSAGGVSRGNVFSRYVNLLTFISIPISYLHFIYQYFKEIGRKLCSNKVFFFYLLPVLNLVLEIFSGTFEKLNGPIPYINLYSFFMGLVLVISVFVYGMVKHKNTEQTYF